MKYVIQNSLQYWGVEPEYNEVPQLEQVAVPDVTNLTDVEAAVKLNEAGLEYLTDGIGHVDKQMPAPGTMIDKGTTVLLYMDTKTEFDEMEGMTVVPDVSNKSIMDAAQAIEDAGLTMSPTGTGTAKYQSPEAGAVVSQGTVVQVEFSESGG